MFLFLFVIVSRWCVAFSLVFLFLRRDSHLKRRHIQKILAEIMKIILILGSSYTCKIYGMFNRGKKWYLGQSVIWILQTTERAMSDVVYVLYVWLAKISYKIQLNCYVV